MLSKKILFLFRKYSSSAALLEGSGRIELDTRLLLSNPTNLKDLTLAQAKAAHALLFKTHELSSNLYAANSLIISYSECSRMDCAFKLFDEIPLRNSVTLNSMILGCNKNSLYGYSWRLFCQIHNVGADMDEFTYGSVLSACGYVGNAAIGLQVYGLVWKNGFVSNGYVRAATIDLFAKCGYLDDALRVLHDVDNCENVVCWNHVVSGAVKSNDHLVALDVFAEMCRRSSISPNSFTFSSALTACAAVEELELGKCIHGCVIKRGVGGDVYVGTAIVDLYAKSGAMLDAVKQFKLMKMLNVVSWNVIISGFAKQGDCVSAFSVLNEMRKSGEELSSFTVPNVLSACTNPDMFKGTLQIHCWTFKVGLNIDPIVESSLISTYSRIGAVYLSEKVFVENGKMKEVGVWANMISAFVQSGSYDKAINFFQDMLENGTNPNMYIVSSVISLIDSLALGRQVHSYSLKLGMLSEVSVGSSILTMYSKCRKLEDSLKAFEQLERKDNVSWTSMIIGLAENGYADKAIRLFQEMGFEPDDRILAAVLNSCSALRSLKLGREVHAFALRFWSGGEQAIVDSALVNMYTKCGDLDSARIVFDRTHIKDQALWSSLISGYSRYGQVEEALEIFRNLLMSGVNSDAYTCSSILGALAISSELGEQLHGYTIKVGFETDASVGSSLVMMYSKSGSISDCHKAFQQITDLDLVGWTTMIASYANNGKGSEALQLFDRMKRSGVEPDGVTFVGVLSACSHAGLVDEGHFHLQSMIRDHGIKPGQKHYACMVDLLGRAGRLEEAKRFIDSMPVEPAVLVWETLLAACKVHGDHELGKVAAEKILESQPNDVGTYISVSNIYAEAGEWDHALKVREAMGVRRKEAGWSYV
ncbi:pentatricopeptide repeat-containing protein At1g74600, chloroplastic-like [Salvia hispanica]|uniref:pentatricopeptide repeat-containing protein At1g74600, chloroplastic-like n=1 Tax=Salvia hispanica TaxID=49212 RepID=UPI002009D2AC|nr:pentatricopeptide repeat-containing protein At1g74600, chloroplastic-like [Salvia hispanica]